MKLLAWPDHEYWDTLLQVFGTPQPGVTYIIDAREKLFVSLSLCRRILNSKHLTTTIGNSYKIFIVHARFSVIDCKRNERGDSNHTIYFKLNGLRWSLY